MTEQLLETLPVYGLPALAAVIVIACLGIPVPASMMLLLSGALVASGDLSLWPTLATAFTAAVLGDNLGFLLGRQAAGPVSRKTDAIEEVGRYLDRRGGWAIFLSRWLIAPIGPAINLAAGAGATPWRRFVLPEVAGEVVWVTLYVSLGAVFGHAFAMLSDALSTVIGLATSLTLGVWAARHLSRKRVMRRETGHGGAGRGT